MFIFFSRSTNFVCAVNIALYSKRTDFIATTTYYSEQRLLPPPPDHTLWNGSPFAAFKRHATKSAFRAFKQFDYKINAIYRSKSIVGRKLLTIEAEFTTISFCCYQIYVNSMTNEVVQIFTKCVWGYGK